MIKNKSIKPGHSDDYLAIEEVITRRFKHWSKYKNEGIDISLIRNRKSSILDPSISSDFPDLISSLINLPPPKQIISKFFIISGNLE